MSDLCLPRYLTLLLMLVMMVPSAYAQRYQLTPSDRVDSLIAEMTLEEKVGQMTQVTLTAIAADGPRESGRVNLDPDKLREAILTYHVGSLFNVIDEALSLDGWRNLISEIQDVATRESRLGIPIIYGVDAVHGHNYLREGTIFPHNHGLAATFNRNLARRAGEVTGDEVLAAGTPWNFAPVLDVGRSAPWPRFYETFGEDVYVTSEMGREVIVGMQRSGRVAATMKHYLGYSAPDVPRDRAPANLTERQIREHFLPPFQAAIDAGAMTIMVNSGDIDAEPVHASRYWLTDVLRDELGFEGVIVSDWEDVIFLHTRHKIAPTLKDAVRMSVEAGLDMSMTPSDYDFAVYLAELVREGSIPESRIDESVRRILKLKEDLGLFDNAYPDTAAPELVATEASREAARLAARESITLLSNDGVLPLDCGARMLVTGPAASSLSALAGGWSYIWQGHDDALFPEGTPTFIDAMRTMASDVTYVAGADFTEEIDIDAAARAAADVDVAVIAVGESGYAEWMGDIRDLTLPDAQLRLIEAVQATGTPTVIVLAQGRPRIIHPYADQANAVVMAYWPGTEGAHAIADVLYGEYNPSGKLPFTYPRHPNALDTYDYKFNQDFGSPSYERTTGLLDPQYEFGHGLSYTTFAYDQLLVPSSVQAGGAFEVAVRVTNTGDRPGREAVLVFSRQHYASLVPYMQRLRAFDKIELQPGESTVVRFQLSTDDLRFASREGRMVLEPGMFDIMVGGLTATFEVVE